MRFAIFDDEEGHTRLDPDSPELLHALHEAEMGGRCALGIPVKLVVEVRICRQGLHLVEEGVKNDSVVGGEEVRLEGLCRPVVRVGKPPEEDELDAEGLGLSVLLDRIVIVPPVLHEKITGLIKVHLWKVLQEAED
jgi:hypothetical protein